MELLFLVFVSAAFVVILVAAVAHDVRGSHWAEAARPEAGELEH